jgi:hypothetical protein
MATDPLAYTPSNKHNATVVAKNGAWPSANGLNPRNTKDNASTRMRPRRLTRKPAPTAASPPTVLPMMPTMNPVRPADQPASTSIGVTNA